MDLLWFIEKYYKYFWIVRNIIILFLIYIRNNINLNSFINLKVFFYYKKYNLHLKSERKFFKKPKIYN